MKIVDSIKMRESTQQNSDILDQKISDILLAGKQIVLFDGVCNFCNASVQFILKNDGKAKFYFAPLQSQLAVDLLKSNDINPDTIDSIVLISSRDLFLESDAALRIARDLRFPWNWGYPFIFMPRFIRDSGYRLIARYRYSWFGKRDQCMLPTAEQKERFLSW